MIKISPNHMYSDRLPAKGIDLFFEEGSTIICGANGCGKTTIMNILADYITKGKQENVSVTGDKGTHTFFIRSQREMDSKTVFDGEQLHRVVKDVEKLMKLGDTCIVMDEPELSLDIEWMIELYKVVVQAEKYNSQFIIISHHPLFVLGKGLSTTIIGELNYISKSADILDLLR